MAKLALKPLLGTVAGATALTLIQTGAAEAALLNYAFEVNVNQGSYAGIYKGALRFDDSKLVPCIAMPDHRCATPSDSNLSVIFNFLGNTYTEKDDVDYGGGRRIRDSRNQEVVIPAFKFGAVYYYPELAQAGQNPFVLSLMVMFPEAEKNFAILGTVFSKGFSKYGSNTSDKTGTAADPNFIIGSVQYFRRPYTPSGQPSPCQISPGSCNPAAVPEPSEIAGSIVAFGILGLFWRSRRKKTTFKP